MEDESQATASGSEQASTSQGGKVKQTRRRQRLSCVECTKRRQRCDRQFPCGLCTTRGIPHLCRWEPIVVRPTPQRPPTAAINAAANSTIETLSARIAALEQALLQQQQQNAAREANNDTTSHSSSMSPPGSSENEGTPDLAHDFVSPPASLEAVAEDRVDDEEPRGPIDYKVQAAAVALAQLSLAPRTEYVGNGTVLCAIHKLGDPASWRVPHPATMLTSPVSPLAPETSGLDRRTWEILSEGFGALDGPAGASPIRRLVAKLPPRAVFDEILDAFFPERSWQFGIPERWFRAGCARMWDHIAMRCVPGCRRDGSCAACREDINPHWLCFVFAVLALAPSPRNSLKDSGRYFMCSIMARRYVEDLLLITPAYSTSEGSVNGGVLTCISSSLHCMYLVDRGRISEAWKLAGSALRNAQALGMHRDPSWRKWEQMNAIDRELRITGWWLLIISDRIWSFVLGRPMMAPRGSYDVMATPADLHTDGTSNKCAAYHRVFIVLTDLVYEASEKCMGTRPPPYSTVLDLDRRFREWENSLPEPLRWKKSGTPGVMLPTPCDRALRYQSTTLAGWYMCALMGIHRPYLMHAPRVLAPPGSAAAGTQAQLLLNPSRERCIEIALELTQIMCDFHDDLAPWRAPGRLNAETFSYMLFDGAVALAGALSQVPPHPRAAECLTLLDRAMGALERHAEQAQGSRDGEGEMANRAMVVLRALRRAGGWDRKDEEKGELVSFQDLLMQARRQQPQPVQTPSSDSSTDFFPSLGAQMGGAQQYSTGTPMFGASPQAQDAPGGSFMSFFDSYPPVASPSMFTNTQSTTQAQGQARSYPAMGLSSDFEMSFTAARPAADQMRPIQSMLMPFNVLQGVQPDSQQHMEDLDLDWARLAGMESWYSGTTTAE